MLCSSSIRPLKAWKSSSARAPCRSACVGSAAGAALATPPRVMRPSDGRSMTASGPFGDENAGGTSCCRVQSHHGSAAPGTRSSIAASNVRR